MCLLQLTVNEQLEVLVVKILESGDSFYLRKKINKSKDRKGHFFSSVRF